MDIASTRWSDSAGWSAPLPDWDGPSTLVLAFGTSSLVDAPGVLDELRDRYPTSTLTGCSGAGHALGSEIANEGLVVTVVRFGRRVCSPSPLVRRMPPVSVAPPRNSSAGC